MSYENKVINFLTKIKDEESTEESYKTIKSLGIRDIAVAALKIENIASSFNKDPVFVAELIVNLKGKLSDRYTEVQKLLELELARDGEEKGEKQENEKIENNNQQEEEDDYDKTNSFGEDSIEGEEENINSEFLVSMAEPIVESKVDLNELGDSFPDTQFSFSSLDLPKEDLDIVFEDAYEDFGQTWEPFETEIIVFDSKNEEEENQQIIDDYELAKQLSNEDYNAPSKFKIFIEGYDSDGEGETEIKPEGENEIKFVYDDAHTGEVKPFNYNPLEILEDTDVKNFRLNVDYGWDKEQIVEFEETPNVIELNPYKNYEHNVYSYERSVNNSTAFENPSPLELKNMLDELISNFKIRSPMPGSNFNLIKGKVRAVRRDRLNAISKCVHKFLLKKWVGGTTIQDEKGLREFLEPFASYYIKKEKWVLKDLKDEFECSTDELVVGLLAFFKGNEDLKQEIAFKKNNDGRYLVINN